MAGLKQPGPVDEKTLQTALAAGRHSEILRLRLAYMERAQLLHHYIGPAAGRPPKGQAGKKTPWLKPNGRCYPSMMPTQASGRWSITEPPLPTFPPDYRDIVVPDDGWVWVHWDYDAIEGRIVAAASHDAEDLEAYAKGYDLHTITGARIFHYPLPTNLRDPHKSPEDAAWRERLQWAGKDDRRRHLAKTARYALFYARDHRGILEVKGVEKLGETPETLLRVGYDFLRAKPNLVATRRRAWANAWRTHRAVTHLGRVRPLLGPRHDVEKEGWNHEVQGTVTDMMNAAILAIDAQWPETAVLAWQSHDGATIAFPNTVAFWPTIRTLVERTYTIAGHEVFFPATWEVIRPEGPPLHPDDYAPTPSGGSA